MKFAIFVNPQIPPGGDPEVRRKLAPIGRNTEHYQMMLEELRELAVLADDIGFHAFQMTEHHFHSEGLEASVNPLMILTDLAARTKRIILAPLGMVLPGWDPVRAAEDVAILDQLCKGRLALGIARGYQPRWCGTLFQNRSAFSTNSQPGPEEDRNQEVFSEMLKIMKMCWTQETVRYQSEVFPGYSIPYPYEGVEGWPPLEWTREYGAPGEVDDDDIIRHVSVIPRPYQDPHPPLWQPFAISNRTIQRCAEMGILPFILTPRPEDFHNKCVHYMEMANANGHNYKLGENVGSLNYVMIGDDKEALIQMGERHVVDDWDRFFGVFGYREAVRMPYDPQPPGEIPSELLTFRRFDECGLAIVGSVDEVKRRIDALIEAGNPDWFSVQVAGLQGNAPREFLNQQLELIAEHIIPAYAD